MHEAKETGKIISGGKNMFDKFGEFGSHEELNMAAAGLLEEGDTESLLALTEENGLDQDDAQEYIDGSVPELATPIVAAVGRLSIQKNHLVTNNKNVAERMAYSVMLSMLQTMCTDEDMAAAIMQKGKTVADIYKAMEDEAKKHASGSGQNRQAISCGTDQELRNIIRTYYIAPAQLRKKIAALYVFDGEV